MGDTLGWSSSTWRGECGSGVGEWMGVSGLNPSHRESEFESGLGE